MSNSFSFEHTSDDALEMMIENCRIRLGQTAEWLAILEGEKEHRHKSAYIEPEPIIEHKRRGW